jgi:xanthine/uracil permease
MKTQTMKHPVSDMIAFLYGNAGGAIAAWIMGITWQTAYESIGHLLWLGFAAAFTGGMGVLGKHAVNKYLKRKNQKP